MNDDSWDLIRKGDEKAFRSLYDKHADILYGYGMKIVSNEDVVTDAIQALFIYLYEKRKTISQPKYIVSYLCVSLRRHILLTLKKERSSPIVSDDTLICEYNFDLELDAESKAINEEIREERFASLQTAISGLTNQQREVIYLKYYKELSNDEIAEILGTNNQVVRNVASRALAKLKEYIRFTNIKI